jgi:hypothetical protein
MNASNPQTKSSRLSTLFQESVFQALLFVAILGALVDRGIALTSGTII